MYSLSLRYSGNSSYFTNRRSNLCLFFSAFVFFVSCWVSEPTRFGLLALFRRTILIVVAIAFLKILFSGKKSARFELSGRSMRSKSWEVLIGHFLQYLSPFYLYPTTTGVSQLNKLLRELTKLTLQRLKSQKLKFRESVLHFNLYFF